MRAVTLDGTPRIVSVVTVGPWRCAGCNLMLAKLHLGAGSVVQIKCPSCKTVNNLQTVCAPIDAAPAV